MAPSLAVSQHAETRDMIIRGRLKGWQKGRMNHPVTSGNALAALLRLVNDAVDNLW